MVAVNTDTTEELETRPTKPVTQDHVPTLSKRPKLDYEKIEHDIYCFIEADCDLLTIESVNAELTQYFKVLNKTIIEVIQITQDLNSVGRIKGLIVHECSNIFSQLISKLSLIKVKESKKMLSYDELKSYKDFINNKLKEFLILLDITINSEDTKEFISKNISIIDLLKTLVEVDNIKISPSIITYNDVPIQIKYPTDLTNTPFIRLEEFYSIRTLILNSIQSLVSETNLNPNPRVLSIELELEQIKDGVTRKKVTITDNSSKNFHRWTTEFYQELMYYYVLGLNDQTNTLMQTKGGAKIAIFLAGKRHRKFYYPNTSPDEIVELGDFPLTFEMSQTDNTKSIILYF